MSDQPSGSSATATAPRSRSNWLIRLLIAAGVVALFGAMSFIWVMAFGFVAGEEFSPQRFERREYSYYQIPILQIQIRPIVRETTTGSLERHLVKSGLVPVIDPPRWDLIADNRYAANSSACDAQILCDYLDTLDENGDRRWLKWSKEHQESANLLWPAVAEAARERLYVLVPEMLDVANRCRRADEFQDALAVTLAESYRRHASYHQQRKNHQRAVELYGLALAHKPADLESLRGRAASLTALGKWDKAAADLAEAKRLDSKRI